ncbi:MAG: hypothetical protein HQL32_09475 [Planctomycetes bacterium]|nr:hypothetical protein [Planctomycetota bacterium]
MPDEAYTGNLIGRRGFRTSPKQFSPEREFVVVDDVVNGAEVNTMLLVMARAASGNRGPRAWHVRRGAS